MPVSAAGCASDERAPHGACLPRASGGLPQPARSPAAASWYCRSRHASPTTSQHLSLSSRAASSQTFFTRAAPFLRAERAARGLKRGATRTPRPQVCALSARGSSSGVTSPEPPAASLYPIRKLVPDGAPAPLAGCFYPHFSDAAAREQVSVAAHTLLV